MSSGATNSPGQFAPLSRREYRKAKTVASVIDRVLRDFPSDRGQSAQAALQRASEQLHEGLDEYEALSPAARIKRVALLTSPHGQQRLGPWMRQQASLFEWIVKAPDSEHAEADGHRR